MTEPNRPRTSRWRDRPWILGGGIFAWLVVGLLVTEFLNQPFDLVRVLVRLVLAGLMAWLIAWSVSGFVRDKH
jgi:hypothetical protein